MLFAAAKLGAVWVPVNTGLRGAFLQHQLHDAEPRVVVLEDRLAKTPTGKLLKTSLREAGITATTWDREWVGYIVRR